MSRFNLVLKALSFFFALQHIVMKTEAKPLDYGCGCSEGVGGYSGGCGFPCPVGPPISFQPVPQPIPIKIPSCKPQSVTIPNIIVALLPPTNKPSPPIIRPCPQPQPLVFPIPQPYPCPVQDCGGCC